jgi:hypothetical protein
VVSGTGRGIAAAAGALAISMSTVPVAAAHGGGVGATDGSYRAVVHHAPRGVVVHPLQGRVAGFFVEVAAGHRLVVRTAEGVDLASIGASDTMASGSWLEERVRMPGQPPAHGHLAVVSRWRVPVTYDGAPGAIRGVVEWVPSGPHDDRSIPTGFMLGVGGGALVTVAVGLARVRRRGRAAP